MAGAFEACTAKRNPAGDHISWYDGGRYHCSIVIEQVFGIPGLGQTLISSISKRDYQVVEAVIVLVAVVVLVMNMITDMLYQKLDKRIEVE